MYAGLIGNYKNQRIKSHQDNKTGIEYTADVVWGLQLQAIHDDLFNKPNKTKEKREKINKAKGATPRKIELVCLKNRTGRSNYSCLFDYYPKFDTFEAQEDYATEFNQGNRGRIQ